MWDPFVAMISSLVLLVKMYTKSPLLFAFLVLGWVLAVGFDMVTRVTIDGGFRGFQLVGVLGFLLFWVGLGYQVPFFGLLLVTLSRIFPFSQASIPFWLWSTMGLLRG